MVILFYELYKYAQVFPFYSLFKRYFADVFFAEQFT